MMLIKRIAFFPALFYYTSLKVQPQWEHEGLSHSNGRTLQILNEKKKEKIDFKVEYET